MKNDNFKEDLKVDTVSVANKKPQKDSKDLEALYRYTESAVNDISRFLFDFYRENPTTEMIESDYSTKSYAQSFYASLDHEIVSKYSDFKDGKLNIEEFEKQFKGVLFHYQTDTLKIQENYGNFRVAEKSYTRYNNSEYLQGFVDNIEAQAEECWSKIEEEKQSQH